MLATRAAGHWIEIHPSDLPHIRPRFSASSPLPHAVSAETSGVACRVPLGILMSRPAVG